MRRSRDAEQIEIKLATDDNGSKKCNQWSLALEDREQR
jgi:hypothetical protein